MSATDDGHWALVHPRELIATFLLPLPDPVPFPAGASLPTYLHLEHQEIETLQSCENELWFQSLEDPRVFSPLGDLRPGRPVHSASNARRASSTDESIARTGPDTTETSTLPGSQQPTPIKPDRAPTADSPDRDLDTAVNWTNKFALSSSILFHQTVSEALVRAQLGVAFDVAQAVSGTMTTPGSVEDAIGERSDSPSHLLASTLRQLDLGALTVAECAVGLRLIVDEPPSAINPLVTTSPEPPPYGPLEADQLHPNQPTLWNWRHLQHSQPNLELLERRLRNALDVALKDVADIFRAAAAVRRTPSRVPTLERLPALIPVLLRRHDQIGTTSTPLAPTLLAPHPNLFALQHPDPFTDAEMQTAVHARDRTTDGAFANHVGLHREARVALQRDGDYRVAALLAGVAAESLLDELLLHLMWEERTTPEQAAADWRSSLISRVRNEYKGRLRGSWELTGSQPIADWESKVAALRNRIVHAAYYPSREEVVDSIETLDRLVTHCCDRLADPASIGRYPRTAIALAGRPGLERRRSYSRRIERLQHDPTETDWNSTFVRWRETWRRTRRDLDGATRTPNPTGSSLLLVVHPDKTLSWCLHDRAQHLATLVDVEASSTPVANFESRALAIASQAFQAASPEPVSFAHLGAIPYRLDDTSAWVEEYHLVPLTQVMVDRSDFSAPLPPSAG